MTMPPYEVVTVATSSGANARTGARVRLVVLRAVPTLQPTQLADQPVPLGMVDRALAGSVSLRRRHRILTAVSALGVIGLISASAAVGLPRLAANFVDPTVPPGSVPTPLVCQIATNEPVPPAGQRAGLPVVARIVLDLLPPRDDYHIGYAFTACERDGQWVHSDGRPVQAGQEIARVQLSVGADNSGGRVKVEV